VWNPKSCNLYIQNGILVVGSDACYFEQQTCLDLGFFWDFFFLLSREQLQNFFFVGKPFTQAPISGNSLSGKFSLFL